MPRTTSRKTNTNKLQQGSNYALAATLLLSGLTGNPSLPIDISHELNLPKKPPKYSCLHSIGVGGRVEGLVKKSNFQHPLSVCTLREHEAGELAGLCSCVRMCAGITVVILAAMIFYSLRFMKLSFNYYDYDDCGSQF